MRPWLGLKVPLGHGIARLSGFPLGQMNPAGQGRGLETPAKLPLVGLGLRGWQWNPGGQGMHSLWPGKSWNHPEKYIKAAINH